MGRIPGTLTVPLMFVFYGNDWSAASKLDGATWEKESRTQIS